MIIFSIVILLAVVQPSYQTVYTCDSSLSCGCSSNPASVTRIVGGETAGTSTWDWAVSISIAGSYLCGGAILSNSWVITAAHCMSGMTASQVTVYAGSNIKYSGQSRVASNVIVHPGYVSSTKLNDIALIRLSTPFTTSSSPIKPICMPYVSAATLAAGEWPVEDTNVVAIGWGTLSESGVSSSTLQQVTVKTIAYYSSTCSSVLNNRLVQFCAGVSGGGKDTCQGDSGGPLMMFTASGQWVLVGLTSYGIGCARAAYAGVYTRVAYYQTWIATTTENAYFNATLSNSGNSINDILLSSHLLFLFIQMVAIKIFLLN